MVPRAVGLAASQLTFLVAVSISTGLGVGAVTAFTFAFSVFQLPIGTIGVPLGVVTLPSMSRELALGEVERYLALVRRTIRLILFVMIPLSGLAIITRGGVVRLLFDYGQMDAEAIQQHRRDAWLAAPGDDLRVGDRDPGPGLLRRARHGHAGHRRDRRRGDQHDPRRRARLAVRPARDRPGDHPRVVGRGDRPDRDPVVAGARPSAPVSSSGSGAVALVTGLVATGAAFLVGQAVAIVVGQEPGKVVLFFQLAAMGLTGAFVYAGLALALRTPELQTIWSLAGAVIRRRTISS